ncbi:MAG: hypothetical protein R2883_08210 [Caldisericia bacterium]
MAHTTLQWVNTEPDEKVFNNFYEINNAYNHRYFKLRDGIKFRIPYGESYRENGKLFEVTDRNGATITTSVGQALYNGIIREALEPAVTHRGEVYRQANDDSYTGKWNIPYYNESMTKNNLQKTDS